MTMPLATAPVGLRLLADVDIRAPPSVEMRQAERRWPCGTGVLRRSLTVTDFTRLRG
jgi:hypothetical protein